MAWYRKGIKYWRYRGQLYRYNPDFKVTQRQIGNSWKAMVDADYKGYTRDFVVSVAQHSKRLLRDRLLGELGLNEEGKHTEEYLDDPWSRRLNWLEKEVKNFGTW